MSAAILFFVRRPEPGKVKTRLAKELGERRDAVTELYRDFVLDMLDALRATGLPVIVCHDPGDAATAGQLRTWLGPGLRYLPQRGRDLGERMRLAFEDAFALGHDRAVLIGSDIPELAPGTPAMAVRALDDTDCVVGPAEDGGYYLIGFARQGFRPSAFAGIAWSTGHVLAETLARLDAAGTRTRLVPRATDVDTLRDLRRLAQAPAGVARRSSARARALLEGGEREGEDASGGRGNRPGGIIPPDPLD